MTEEDLKILKNTKHCRKCKHFKALIDNKNPCNKCKTGQKNKFTLKEL